MGVIRRGRNFNRKSEWDENRDLSPVDEYKKFKPTFYKNGLKHLKDKKLLKVLGFLKAFLCILSGI